MTGFRLHSRVNGKRRGGCLPGRLRIAARRGVSLVELMISMLILAVVCIAWLQIIGIQSARKEARRREAVERLAGMMDAFMYEKRTSISIAAGSYSVVVNTSALAISIAKDADTDVVHSVFGSDVSPIGYQLCVVAKTGLENHEDFGGNWNGKWLVGKLYDRNGSLDEAGKPFFTLPVCLGL